MPAPRGTFIAVIGTGILVLGYIADAITHGRVIRQAFIDCAHFIHPTPTPPTITEMKGPIVVTGNRAPNRPDGRYFDFNAKDLDAALGDKDWHHKRYLITRQRDHRSAEAVMFRDNDDAGHGRFSQKEPPLDWKEGDSFTIYPISRGHFRDE